MTKVKICGITNLEDAQLAAKFGADALGFNFYEKSPRYIAPEKAGAIIEQLPENVLKVGVFVNESLEKTVEIARNAKLDALQLHGEETPRFASELKAQTNFEIIKAFRVSPEFVPEDVLQYEVDAILLDAYNPNEHGGTGETFDWEIAKRVREIFPKMYLAGGITNENIYFGLRDIKPFAVDVCSGVESKKGKKDKVKVINFISRVRNINKALEKRSNTRLQQNKPNLFTVPKNYFFNLMSEIHSFPAMYIGKKSLSLLKMFISGFYFATDKYGINFEGGFYPNFNDWLRKHLLVEDDLPINFSELILKECNGDEEKAFDLFFALLEEFKLEKEDLGEN